MEHVISIVLVCQNLTDADLGTLTEDLLCGIEEITNHQEHEGYEASVYTLAITSGVTGS